VSETLTLKVSGALYDELRHGTSLGANWGYGATTAVDIEVEQMVKSATGIKRGFGYQYAMTGSPAAWLAIKEYAVDRSYMELNMSGDMDRGLGRALGKQAERIASAL
jgi:hypothetical protein